MLFKERRYGSACYFKGHLSDAEEYLPKGINFAGHSTDTALQAGCYFFLGETYVNTGKYAQAGEALERAISLLEQQRILTSWLNLFRLARSLSKILGGDLNIDLELLSRYQGTNKMTFFVGYLQRYLSAIMLNVDAKRLP